MGARAETADLQRRAGFSVGARVESAFTIIELLVSISIVSLAAAILLPALGRARRQARFVLSGSNQRQIVGAAALFAGDNDGFYPESVATIGTEPVFWNWQEPMMLIGYRARSPRLHRSASAYLRQYIDKARIFYCPSAPYEYEYLEQAWEAGDDWDNPDTPPVQDPLSGTYCLYWDYTGHLEEKDWLFQGPRNMCGGSRQSTLLVSDYFGYDHYRSNGAYGSCERFGRGDVTEGSTLSSPYWSSRGVGGEKPGVKLHAGYTDGHVGSYSSRETMTMRVIMDVGTGEPYPRGIGPGEFFLPWDAGR